MKKLLLGLMFINSVLFADFLNLEQCLVKNTNEEQKQTVKQFVFLLKYSQDKDLKPLLKTDNKNVNKISKKTGNIISHIIMTKCKKEMKYLIKNNNFETFYKKFGNALSKYLADIYANSIQFDKKEEDIMIKTMIKNMDNKDFGNFIHNLYAK
jgi:hypothetical protein